MKLRPISTPPDAPRLFDEICALEAQAWMTGTGPELFAELGDRAQHIAVRRPTAFLEIAPDDPHS
jgi:DNA replication and repair protein RecF